MHTLLPRLAAAIVGALLAALTQYIGYEVTGELRTALEAAVTTFLTLLVGLASYAWTHRKGSAKVNPGDAATTPVAQGVAATHDPERVRAAHGRFPDPGRRLP